MGHKRESRKAQAKHTAGAGRETADAGPAPARLKRKDYEKHLEKLHGELVNLQLWVQATGAKVCIVFEGRDGAGKGGTIKALTERVRRSARRAR